jgi:hypothetical protein
LSKIAGGAGLPPEVKRYGGLIFRAEARFGNDCKDARSDWGGVVIGGRIGKILYVSYRSPLYNFGDPCRRKGGFPMCRAAAILIFGVAPLHWTRAGLVIVCTIS